MPERKIWDLAPEKKIIPPKEGWKEKTFYQVRVSYAPSNFVHSAIFQVGFLNKDGTPGNYSEVWNNSYDNANPFSEVWYLEVVKELFKEEKWDGNTTT